MSLREYGRLRWKLKVTEWRRGIRKWVRQHRCPAGKRLEEQMDFGW